MELFLVFAINSQQILKYAKLSLVNLELNGLYTTGTSSNLHYFVLP